MAKSMYSLNLFFSRVGSGRRPAISPKSRLHRCIDARRRDDAADGLAELEARSLGISH
jgi:hypothetical protein